MNRIVTLVIQTLLSALLAAALVLWLRSEEPLEPQSTLPSAGSTATGASPPAKVVADRSSYRSAVQAAMPSVVNIYTAKNMPRRGWWQGPRLYGDEVPQRATSLGSGVIWGSDGLIVTNNHVVQGADEIAVVIGDRQPLAAKVLGTDPETDLAVLRVEVKGLPVIARGNSRQLEVGDVVLAIGNPFGVGQTVTQGIVSATRRNRLGINTFEDFIQTDASINPGNSGGALVDSVGALVGINTAIYTRSEGSVGIGFAIPVELVDTVVSELLKSGRIKRGYLGVQSVDLTPDVAAQVGVKPGPGAVIAALEPRGPAARAGLRPGDVVRGVANKAIQDGADLVTRTAGMKPGEVLTLQVERRGQPLTIEVRLGERPIQRPVPDAEGPR